jgi:hypothetical protein
MTATRPPQRIRVHDRVQHSPVQQHSSSPDHTAEREAQVTPAIVRLQRTIGNRAVQRLMTPAVQRAEDEQDLLAQIREELDSTFNVDEGQVLTWLGQLDDPQKREVAEGRTFDYKGKMASAFSLSEMLRAVNMLNMPLARALEWVDASVVFTRSISYSDIRSLVQNASDRSALDSDHWRDFFVRVCTNADIIQAVGDIGLPLHRQLEWVMEEVASARISLNYSDIRPLILDSSADDQMIFTQGRWRDWLFSVCDNATILEALKDLKIPIRERVRLVLEEGNADILLGGGIDPAKLAEALLATDEFSQEAREVIELAGLNHWDPEDAKRIREIMDSKQSSRPEEPYTDVHGETANTFTSEAEQVIDQFTDKTARYDENGREAGETRSVRMEELAAHLYSIATSNPSLVRRVVETISNHESFTDDNLSRLILGQAPTEDDLKPIAASPEGRDLLLKMVQHMYRGSMSAGDKLQMQRAMRAVSAAENDSREASAQTEEETGAEVEVFTFLYGGKALDSVGKAVGNFRGHTAIAVGGVVYSFEMGWRCGLTREEYIHEKAAIDFVGHVLSMSPSDAAKLQANLNASCGTGAYIVQGEICTGKASIALEEALGTTLYSEVENPGLFAQYLESAGVVKSRRFYPAQQQQPAH